ncbi:transposable element Tc1 transposase [Trichonephila clavipes]|nr:transposable element Tc1 transposase [Trichonephila clavipes]
MIIHRRLIERNLRSCRPSQHLPLIPAHCRARLQWCLARSGWNHADWGRIVFSDESHFPLCPDDHLRHVWRRPWQRADPAFTIVRSTGPQPRLIKHFLGQPDPSPIEHVWNMMGRRLHLPGNVDDLARQLEQIWQEIPQETIRVIYHSMSRLMAACIQVKGGSTPY